MTAKKQIQQIASTVLGVATGLYCGIMVFFPIIGGWIAAALAKRFASKSFQPFTPALAIICGQAFWMFIAVLMMVYLKHNSWLAGLYPVSFDLLAMTAGILWLLGRPGLGPVIFLSIYEVLVLVINVIAICGTDLGSYPHKGLTLGIILRLGSLWLLFAGYRQFKKAATEELSTEPPPQIQTAGPIHILTEDGQQSVYEESQVLDLLARNALSAGTYYWREGMKDWQPASNLAPRT